MERRGLIWLASFFWRIDVEVVIKKLADLKHVEGNTRLHSAKQIQEYVRSIETFGQLRPMLIDENNVVLTGERIFVALQSLGRTTAACRIITGLSVDDKERLRLADERIFNLTDGDLFADGCTCPQCGFTFNYNEAKINGN